MGENVSLDPSALRKFPRSEKDMFFQSRVLDCRCVCRCKPGGIDMRRSVSRDGRKTFPGIFCAADRRLQRSDGVGHRAYGEWVGDLVDDSPGASFTASSISRMKPFQKLCTHQPDGECRIKYSLLSDPPLTTAKVPRGGGGGPWRNDSQPLGAFHTVSKPRCPARIRSRARP